MNDTIPCECGNDNASWRGEKRSYRFYSCIKCWEADPTREEYEKMGNPYYSIKTNRRQLIKK